MRRHEAALLVLAIVLLVGAWELSSDFSQPGGSWSEGEIPWNVLLWQFRHALATPLSLVGLASAVSILFLRAARWGRIPAAEMAGSGELAEPTDIAGPPLG